METSNSLMIPEEINRKLQNYAKLIYDYNKTTNITGLKDVESIYNELVVRSIKPLMNIDVPRGTSFVDIGTGAGIPGIPLILYFGDNIKGVLIDSNNKKIKFLLDVIDVLGMHDNVTVIQGRVEEMLKEKKYRDSYNFVVARAFAHPLMALEYGLPFVKQGGWLYIYSNLNVYDLSLNNTAGGHAQKLLTTLIRYSAILGGHMAAKDEAMKIGVQDGFLILKDYKTPPGYPRKHTVVARDVKKLRAAYED